MTMKETIGVLGGLLGTFILIWILALSLGFLPGSNRHYSTFKTMREGFSLAASSGSTVITGMDFFYEDSYTKPMCNLLPEKLGITTKKPNPKGMGWIVQKNAPKYNFAVIIFTKSEGLIDHLTILNQTFFDRTQSGVGDFNVDMKIIKKNIAELSNCRSGYCMCYVELYYPFARYLPEGFEIIVPQIRSTEMDAPMTLSGKTYSNSAVEIHWEAFTLLHKNKLFQERNFLNSKPIIKECIDFASVCSCTNPTCGYQTSLAPCESFSTYGNPECTWSGENNLCVQSSYPACLPTVSSFIKYPDSLSFTGAFAVAAFSPVGFYQQTTTVEYWTKDKPLDVGDMKDQQIYIDRVGCILNIRDMSRQNEYYSGAFVDYIFAGYKADRTDLEVADRFEIVGSYGVGKYRRISQYQHYTSTIISGTNIYPKGLYPSCPTTPPSSPQSGLDTYDSYFYGKYIKIGDDYLHSCTSEGCNEWVKRAK